MQKKTNSYVEAVKMAVKKQEKDELLGLDFQAVNYWVWHMTGSHAKLAGKGLTQL